jgi:calcineurin-binding protein cabin-1
MKLKMTMPSSIGNDFISKENGEASSQVVINSISSDHGPLKVDETSISERMVEEFKESHFDKKRRPTTSEQVCDIEKKKTEIGLDMALDQSYFCLYGLNLRSGLDSTGGQDGLAMHMNTSLGEYQTKDQCAEVFQYLLPYARVCTVKLYCNIPTADLQLTFSASCKSIN